MVLHEYMKGKKRMGRIRGEDLKIKTASEISNAMD